MLEVLLTNERESKEKSKNSASRRHGWSVLSEPNFKLVVLSAIKVNQVET